MSIVIQLSQICSSSFEHFLNISQTRIGICYSFSRKFFQIFLDYQHTYLSFQAEEKKYLAIFYFQLNHFRRNTKNSSLDSKETSCKISVNPKQNLNFLTFFRRKFAKTIQRGYSDSFWSFEIRLKFPIFWCTKQNKKILKIGISYPFISRRIPKKKKLELVTAEGEMTFSKEESPRRKALFQKKHTTQALSATELNLQVTSLPVFTPKRWYHFIKVYRSCNPMYCRRSM